MSILKDRLIEALNAKNNDINTFIWKGPKEEINGQKIQTEIKMIDATEEQLKSFYTHCMSMLYSHDPINPGRYTLIDMIQVDRDKCNTELYLRWLEGSYLPDDQRAKYPRFRYLQDIKKVLERNSVEIPREKWGETSISVLMSGMPEEFEDLTIDMVIDGCLDKLGNINRKPITLSFITKMGVWFKPNEMKDLTERDEETGKIKDRLDVVRERLGLRNNVSLRVDPTGLDYLELRSMVNLKSKKFRDLTTDQLLVLRNKILFRLENEAVKHSELWVEQIRRIKLVAEAKGIQLEETNE